MEHVVVKLSVCRNYVELLADVCLFVLCSHVIMSLCSPQLLLSWWNSVLSTTFCLQKHTNNPYVRRLVCWYRSTKTVKPGQIKLSSSFLTQAIANKDVRVRSVGGSSQCECPEQTVLAGGWWLLGPGWGKNKWYDCWQAAAAPPPADNTLASRNFDIGTEMNTQY